VSSVARFPVPQKSVEKTLGGARLVGVAVIGFMAALAVCTENLVRILFS
jgi:hypothetical protein